MSSENAMTVDDSSQTLIRLEGKYSAIIICWILGLGSLISWNSLASIEDYYYDVFPDYHPSRVLTLVYQPFAFGTMAFLAFNESKIDTRKRIILGYIMFFLGTLALLSLDLVTSGKGSIGSYVAICLIVAAFGAADALIQGGMLGDLALMCPEFIQSFLAGLAASGALTSALRLLTELVFSNIDDGLRKGALLFLSISTLFQFLCIFLYALVFTKLPIVKHYRRKAALEGSKTVSSDLSAAGIQTVLTEKLVAGDPSNLDRLSNKELLFQNIDYALDLFLIFVLTLSIFPGFLYENTGTHQLGSCNGYLMVCVLMAAPKGYKGPEQNALGNLLVFFLLGGIFLGAALDWLWLIGNGSF
ncbi:hypothetical protein L1987_63105 [Smallanthus sonchifolius]|uniref:Uncharacterized protein n=1 Tax=Smallanthus sonchifolius TaxID=185202 RepID=A0ACB9CCJ7_9ASTR|nr:hypothetical protein L1987_63105 [Smallanthus sonchifolius]